MIGVANKVFLVQIIKKQMRNLLLSLYLIVIALMSVISPCCAKPIAAACCSQQAIILSPTQSIQNEDCCCGSQPIKQSTRSTQLIVSNNPEQPSIPQGLFCSAIFTQSACKSSSVLDNKKFKPTRFYILFRALLI